MIVGAFKDAFKQDESRRPRCRQASERRAGVSAAAARERGSGSGTRECVPDRLVTTRIFVVDPPSPTEARPGPGRMATGRGRFAHAPASQQMRAEVFKERSEVANERTLGRHLVLRSTVSVLKTEDVRRPGSAAVQRTVIESRVAPSEGPRRVTEADPRIPPDRVAPWAS